MKHRLRTTISMMLIATLATGLAGMAWVDLDYADTACLCFVLDKRVQLGERPAMQVSLVIAFLTVLLATSQLGGVPDVLEVFQHDGGTWERVLDEALREDMVVVFASPKLFARELLEVSLGASGAFGLQLSFQTEGTPFLFLPRLLAQELTSRSDSWPVQT